MEPCVYEKILQQLKELPQEKVLEAQHFIDFLEQQSKCQAQGYAARFSDLCDPLSREDDTQGVLLETIDEGYQGMALTVHS